MDNLKTNTAAPERAAATFESAMRDQLEEQSDEALRELMMRAMAILENRTRGRRRDAIAEIQRLAKENELTVNVKTSRRKRGRSNKTSPVVKQNKESAPAARSGKAA